MKVLKFIKDNFSKSANLVLLVLGVVVIFGLLAFSSINVFALIGVDSGVTGTVSAGDLNKGLVGYWPMDGTHFNSSDNRVNDLSGYANHGTNYGATLTAGRMGKSNGAMNFGASSRIEIPFGENYDVSSNDLTLSMWVKPDTTTDSQMFAAFGTNTDSRRAYFAKYNGKWDMGIRSSGWGSGVTPVTTDWTYIVVVFDSSLNKATMYVNGEFSLEKSYTDYSLLANLKFAVYGNNGYQFYGKINDARIYNRAISEDEIKQLYNSYKPKLVSGSLQKGLVLDMPLTLDYTKDETTGSEIMTDKTPYGNDGQNYGATLGSNGVSFDGIDDYVKIDNVVVSNPSELTISGWIKKESGGSNYECALHQGSDSTIGNSSYWFGVDSSDYLTATIGARTGVGWSAGKTSIIADYGEWYYLAASWDGSVVKVYINGDYIKQYNLGTYSSLVTPTRMGASTDGTNYQFKGEVSNVKIYNRALSEEEIELLYDKGKY